ncbi:MAG TPA: hypothetical protein VFI39_08710 [Gemmatimonadales bacterium]|nr:hypothetical protein [Gemmatimonadales bacterium]
MPEVSGASSSRVARFAAVLLAVFGLLPIANWIPGGHRAAWYALVLSGWLSGLAIVAGAGVVLAIFGRGLPLWREGLWTRLAEGYRRRPGAVTVLVAVAAGLVYAWIARFILGGRPLLIDEIIESYQALIYAGGHLALPLPAHPEFFSATHLIDFPDKVYSQFPFGGPAVLTIGVLLGVPWITGPLAGTLAVIAFGVCLRRLEPAPGTALAALLLFAFAPFMAFMAGSYMNHVPTLAALLFGSAGLAGMLLVPRAGWRSALACGLGFGIAAAIRPEDAVAFALPASVWLVAGIRDRRVGIGALAVAAAAFAVPVGALLAVNWATTGAPLRFGYEVLWGPSHGLGFHRAPWGVAHTPARGVQLISLYLLRLQTYLFEWPIPSLLPAIAALWYARRLAPFDRYLMAAGTALLGLYFAYWHDGFYLGPRFVYLLLPLAALWTARCLPNLRARFGDGAPVRGVAYGLGVAVVMGLGVGVPQRASQYRNGLVTMRWDADRAADSSGVHGALVFVRESWGAELIARLWALGVARPDAEQFYRRIDACRLDGTLTELERTGVRDSAAARALRPLLADSLLLRGSPVSPDTTEQFLPPGRYTRECVDRINEDRTGFTLFPPLLLARGGENLYVRDLAGRDTLLLAEYPSRPVFLLKPGSARIGAEPRFYPASRDSIIAVARRVIDR